MTTMRVVLAYGLIAEVLVEETERQPYKAPPVPREDHAATCGCDDCKVRRGLDRRGVA